MTTAPADIAQFMDFEVPEHLSENASEIIGRVLGLGGALPPAKMVQKSNNPYMHFHTIVEPLSVKYDSDLTKFDDNFEHIWTPMYTQSNKPQGPQSNFGELKEAFAKCGFVITNAESVKPIVGKVFRFVNRKKTIDFGKVNATTGLKDKDEKDFWLLIPVEVMPDNWQPTGTVQTIQRPRNRNTVPSAASVGGNDAVVLPKLREILDGVAENEYLQAIIASGDSEVGVQPYITEAGGNPSALTARLTAIGMKVVDGKLVK